MKPVSGTGAALLPGTPCRNCGAAVNEQFCGRCGQGADVHVPSTRELLHEVLEGLTHSDSRLWRTLQLLWFRPGQLTREFVAGRRVAYLPPFRLYLIMSVVFFLVTSATNSHIQFLKLDGQEVGATPQESCSKMDISSLPGYGEWNARLQRACLGVLNDRGENLQHVFIAAMPKSMFVFLPLIAFFSMLLYWWPRHRYAEQLLFFLHLHAFFFSAMTLLLLLGQLGKALPAAHGTVAVLEPLIFWWMFIYAVLAMRRYFGRSWFGTLCHAFALFIVYMVVLAFTFTATFVYAALQL
jgi:hypothetical protein